MHSAHAERPSLSDRYAVWCSDVTKRFIVVDEGGAWRLLLGGAGTGEIVDALRGVSLCVPKGKILGVLGRNGAGKSTLLRILGGVVVPTSGRLGAEGSLVGLFELGGLGNPHITGREYAARILRFLGTSGSQLNDLLDEVREFAELEEFFDRRVRTYSSGMAARLYFATATALPHDVYLIDELLSVGDEHFQAKCWRRIRERLTGGASGVLVTHDWSAVIKLCEEACVLERGSIVLHGPADRVIADYLQLPKPELALARFGELPEEFKVQASLDCDLQIPLEFRETCEAQLAFSVELLRLGVGWEVVMLSEFHGLGSHKGKYTAHVRIPSLPLAAGIYSLNLFLKARSPGGAMVVSDTKSWTLGNGLRLTVEGLPSEGLIRLPLTLKKENAHNAAH